MSLCLDSSHGVNGTNSTSWIREKQMQKIEPSMCNTELYTKANGKIKSIQLAQHAPTLNDKSSMNEIERAEGRSRRQEQAFAGATTVRHAWKMYLNYSFKFICLVWCMSNEKYNDFLHSIAKFHTVAFHEFFHADDEMNKRTKNEIGYSDGCKAREKWNRGRKREEEAGKWRTLKKEEKKNTSKIKWITSRGEHW